MSIEIELAEFKKARETAKHEFQEFGAKINADGYAASKEDLDKFTSLQSGYQKANEQYESALSKREDQRGRDDRLNSLKAISDHDEKFKAYDYKPRDASENPRNANRAADIDRAFAAWAAASNPEMVSEEEVRAAKRCGINVFAEEITPLPTAVVQLPNGDRVKVADRVSGGVLFDAHRTYIDGLHSHVVQQGANYAATFQATADATGDSRDTDGYGRLNRLPTVLAKLEQNMYTYGGILDHPITITVTDDYEDIRQDVFDDTANVGRQVRELQTIGENKRAPLDTIVWRYFDYTSDDFELSNRQLERSRYNMPTIIGAALGERLGRCFGTVLTTGNGVNEPDGARTATLRIFKGDANHRGSAKVVTAASATLIAVDELGGTGPEYKLDQMFTNGPSVGWSMHRAILGYLETLKDGNGQPFFQLGMETTSNRRTLRNYPIFFNYALASTHAANDYVAGFGDWSKIVLRRAGGGVPVLIRDVTSKRRQLITIFTALMSLDQRLMNLGNMPISWLRMAGS
jgi:HK97 family phage major capsid protein